MNPKTLRFGCSQVDNEVLEDVSFEFDRQWMDSRLARHLGFWQGSEAPCTVAPEEAFKCGFCPFAKLCPGGIANSRVRMNWN